MMAPPDGLIGRPNRYGNAAARSRSKTQAAGSAAIDMVAVHWAVVRPSFTSSKLAGKADFSTFTTSASSFT